MVVIGKMCLMGVITMTHTKDLNRSINNIVDVLFIQQKSNQSINLIILIQRSGLQISEYYVFIIIISVFLASYRVKLIKFCIPYLSIYDVRILVVPPI
jgi:hypothetical protein